MPQKTFATSTVLTASDVNTYLMDQAVMTFATTSARDTALPTPSEGMMAYVEDTPDRTYTYSGSRWYRWDHTWISFTPTLTGTTSNPTPGSGSVLAGYHRYEGDIWRARIEFDSGSPWTVGSGTYQFAAPSSGGPTLVASQSTSSGHMAPNSTAIQAAQLYPASGTSWIVRYVPNAGTDVDTWTTWQSGHSWAADYRFSLDYAQRITTAP